MGKGQREYEGPQSAMAAQQADMQQSAAAAMTTNAQAVAQQAANIPPVTEPPPIDQTQFVGRERPPIATPEPDPMPALAAKAITDGHTMARQYALAAARLCESSTMLQQSTANARRLLRLALAHLE